MADQKKFQSVSELFIGKKVHFNQSALPNSEKINLELAYSLGLALLLLVGGGRWKTLKCFMGWEVDMLKGGKWEAR